MSALKRAGSRYQLAKLFQAAEEFMFQLTAGRQAQAASFSESVNQAVSKAKEAYAQPMTQSMYIAGKAMAPTLNRAAMTNPHAVEKLIIRTIPRPTPRNIFSGDIVALNSPLGAGSGDAAHVMVRRVVAVEGDELVASNSSEDEEVIEVPKAHCWVVADNEELKPPQVIDSRTFGFLPMSNIVGRVIYAGSSPSHHGPVRNHEISAALDDPVIDAEVDPEELFSEDSNSDSK